MAQFLISYFSPFIIRVNASNSLLRSISPLLLSLSVFPPPVRSLFDEFFIAFPTLFCIQALFCQMPLPLKPFFIHYNWPFSIQRQRSVRPVSYPQSDTRSSCWCFRGLAGMNFQRCVLCNPFHQQRYVSGGRCCCLSEAGVPPQWKASARPPRWHQAAPRQQEN